MSITSSAPRLTTLAAACLLSVALPAVPSIAKEKTKTTPAATTEQSQVDFSVSIPSIDAVDSNVDDETLKAILSGSIVDNAETLAGLTAASITVPEIEITVTSQDDDEPTSATVTLSDLVLTDIVDGIAGSVSLGETDMNTEDGNVNFGTLSAGNFNIALMLGFYGLVDTTGQTELQTIYTDFSSEGGTLDVDDMKCSIGAVSGAEFKARPLQTSLLDMVAMAEGLEDDAEDMDPAVMGEFMRMYADIITAFETSEVTFDGMECRGSDEDGKSLTFSLAGMSMGAMSPGVYPAISMNGFDFAVKGEGSMSLDSLTIKPMDLSNLVETLQNVPDSVDELWLEANARRLFPEMEGFAFSGFSIDIADPETEGARIKADIGSFDLTLANYLDSVPTSSDMSAKNIQFEVPSNTDDETFNQLRALGLTDVDMGFRIAAAWDEATSTIDIEEISINGASLGTMTLAGTIANATAGLFDIDPDVALAAAMGIAVKSLDLDIVDDGVSDIAFGAIAQQEGTEIGTLRPVYAGLAEGTIIGAMVGMADAAKVGSAVSAFIAGKAKTLSITVESKEEPGITVVDFMAAETDPSALLGKVNVSAASE